jgi:Mor family transcriptional regulator
MNKANPQKDKSIIKDYLDNKSIKFIQTKYNCSDHKIENVLNRNGIKRQRGFIRNNHKNCLTKKEDNRITNFYNKGWSSLKIAKKLNCSKYAVLCCLKRNKINRRTTSEAGRKCNIDETVFDDRSSEEALYWVGFLMADGKLCRTKNGDNYKSSYSFGTGIHKKDITHLYKFRKFLKSSHSIVRYKDLVQLMISSEKIYKKLEGYGLTRNKSLTAKASDDIILNRHFWRGVIDGDGSIFFNRKRPCLSICGSWPMMNDFKKYIKYFLKKDIKVYKCKMIFSVQLAALRDVCSVIKEIYQDCNIFLNRKKKLADYIFENFKYDNT